MNYIVDSENTKNMIRHMVNNALWGLQSLAQEDVHKVNYVLYDFW